MCYWMPWNTKSKVTNGILQKYCKIIAMFLYLLNSYFRIPKINWNFASNPNSKQQFSLSKNKFDKNMQQIDSKIIPRTFDFFYVTFAILRDMTCVLCVWKQTFTKYYTSFLDQTQDDDSLVDAFGLCQTVCVINS